MKRIIATILVLCSLAFAAPVQKQENPDFTTMEQIARVATENLSGKGYRVVFASEDDRESLQLRHWIVTVQKYPADYKTVDDRTTVLLFGGPPCAAGKAGEALTRIALVKTKKTSHGGAETRRTAKIETAEQLRDADL